MAIWIATFVATQQNLAPLRVLQRYPAVEVVTPMLPSAASPSSNFPARAKSGFHIPASVKEVENQDGAVLLDIDQGLCFSLTPVACRIWQLLKRNCDVEEIAKTICAEFTAPRDLVERDLAEFLDSLRQNQLLFDEDHRPKRERFRGWLWRTLSWLRD